jgi:hypothetical protein
VVTHRSPLSPLLLFLPMSIYGSSLSVSVQTGITPGPNCSMQAMTTASCSSSVVQVSGGGLATSTATASYGDLSGHTQSGGSLAFGTFAAFDTSYSEMLTITNHVGAGTLISRFEMVVLAKSDAFFNPQVRIGIHQGQATYDSGLISSADQEVVVTSTFVFGVPFVFSAEMIHSWNGCCTDNQDSLGLLQLTSFTVLDGDNNTLTNAVITNDQLSTPEPRTTSLVAVGLLALLVTLRKRLMNVG